VSYLTQKVSHGLHAEFATEWEEAGKEIASHPTPSQLSTTFYTVAGV